MNSQRFLKVTQSWYIMRCAIWYHLYNLKNAKNTHGGVLILVKLHGCFSCFLNCTNATKSRNASHMQNHSTFFEFSWTKPFLKESYAILLKLHDLSMIKSSAFLKLVWTELIPMSLQKQPSRSVLIKRCSENIQQSYRRTPMPKCDIVTPCSSVSIDNFEHILHLYTLF